MIGDINSDAINLNVNSYRTYHKSYSMQNVQIQHFHNQSFRKAQKLPKTSETDAFFSYFGEIDSCKIALKISFETIFRHRVCNAKKDLGKCKYTQKTLHAIRNICVIKYILRQPWDFGPEYYLRFVIFKMK